MQNNFQPTQQGTANAAVTGTTGDITFIPGSCNAIMLTNVGTQTVFWKYKTGGAVASVDTPVLANTQTVFYLPSGVNIIAAIASGAGSTLYVTPGFGS